MAIHPIKLEIPTSKSLTWIFIIVLAMAATSTYCIDGKRFDCQMFCRQTGYHGMVGGCRCSFTLFTSKRSLSPLSSNYQGSNALSRDVILALDSRFLRKKSSMETPRLSRFIRQRPLFGNSRLEGRP